MPPPVRVVRGLADATLIRILDAGHQPAIDDPIAVARAIAAGDRRRRARGGIGEGV